MKISFDGVAPYGTLSIENNCDSSAPQSYVEYTADKTSELKNGDTIAVTAGLKPGAEDEGYVLKETEAAITAEGLDSYVTDVSMLGAEDVGTLEDKLKEEIRAEYVDAFNFCTADGQSITTVSYTHLSTLCTACSVAPLVGAWIETSAVSPDVLFLQGRSPRGSVD